MLVEILSLAAVFLVGTYVHWRIKNRRVLEMIKNIPGPTGINLARLILQTIRKSHFEMFQLVRTYIEGKYKEIIKIQIGNQFLFGLYNPKDIELVLGSNVHLQKSSEYSYFEPWFGNGLLISAGDTWSAHRKMIAPTFHLNVLKRFMKQFNIRGRAVVEKMAKENGREFDSHHYMSECTVETLVETVMGAEKCFSGNNKTCYNYAMAVMDMCDILHLRHTKIWLRIDSLYNRLNYHKKQTQLLELIHKFTNRVFSVKKEAVQKNKKEGTAEQHKEEQQPIATVDDNQLQDEKYSFGRSAGLKDDIDDNSIGEKKRSPFLETLIERSLNDEGITEQEVINQVNTIMFEGHDTTAAGSSFFLCAMAALPEIQAKCHEELDSIFGDSDRDVTFQDTLEMKYLERCLLETLRMFPPVPAISRVLAHDLKLSSGDYTLPKGGTVGLVIYALHRRADVFPNPEKFDPDNFLPERSANRHYYSFIPFSAGPRSCVGRKYAMLKLKILLAHILRNYQVTGGQPIDQWKLQADIILKRADGFNISLKPRKPNLVKSM